MSQLILQSQQYLQDGQFKCYCCNSHISQNAEVCGRCYMPASISHSAQELGVPPTFIPILGNSGAGKTVYLGMLLDLLSKGRHGISGQPNNSFSVAVQQETMMALERRRFPKKTPVELEEWHWIHCNVEYQIGKRKRSSVDIAAPDLAGEALNMELDHPHSFPVVQHCISQAAGIILLIDSLKVCQHANDEDLLATKIATYVHGLVANGNKTPRTPLAVAFTKSDLCEDVAINPFDFSMHNLPSFMAYLERNLPNAEFFASSVVGSVTNVTDDWGSYFVPLHVQPRGIVEPLNWILSETK